MTWDAVESTIPVVRSHIAPRTLSDTFAGIAPASVVPFIAAQFVGAIAAAALARWFYPNPAEAAEDLAVRR